MTAIAIIAAITFIFSVHRFARKLIRQLDAEERADSERSWKQVREETTRIRILARAVRGTELAKWQALTRQIAQADPPRYIHKYYPPRATAMGQDDGTTRVLWHDED